MTRQIILPKTSVTEAERPIAKKLRNRQIMFGFSHSQFGGKTLHEYDRYGIPNFVQKAR